MIKLEYEYEKTASLTEEPDVVSVRYDDLSPICAELTSKGESAEQYTDSDSGLTYVEVNGERRFCASMKDKTKKSKGPKPGDVIPVATHEIDKFAVATRIFKAKIGRKPLYEDPEVMKFVMEALAR